MVGCTQQEVVDTCSAAAYLPTTESGMDHPARQEMSPGAGLDYIFAAAPVGGIQQLALEQPVDRIVTAHPVEGARGTVVDPVPASACCIGSAAAVADAAGDTLLKGFSDSDNSHSPCSYPWYESEQIPRGLRSSPAAGEEAAVVGAY